MRLVFLSLLAMSTAACASHTGMVATNSDRSVASTTGASDREAVEDQMAILHTQNYDYACASRVKDDDRMINATLWLDQDFNGPGPNGRYRLGHSFAENLKVTGRLGVELPITNVSKGRCLKMCLVIETLDSGKPVVYSIKESTDGTILLTGTKDGEEIARGTCVKTALNKLKVPLEEIRFASKRLLPNLKRVSSTRPFFLIKYSNVSSETY